MAKIGIRKRFAVWLSHILEWIYDKTIDKLVARVSLEGQVRFARRMMAFPSVGMPKVRADLLVGLPTDIREKAERGMTKEQIKDYYWGCEPFKSLWTKDLQMEEATLDELIRGSLEPVETTI